MQRGIFVVYTLQVVVSFLWLGLTAVLKKFV